MFCLWVYDDSKSNGCILIFLVFIISLQTVYSLSFLYIIWIPMLRCCHGRVKLISSSLILRYRTFTKRTLPASSDVLKWIEISLKCFLLSNLSLNEQDFYIFSIKKHKGLILQNVTFVINSFNIKVDMDFFFKFTHL